MAKPRAILKRRKAVRNIAKITRTMQLIATAKFKRAMDRAVAARPYTDRLKALIADLTAATGDFEHPLLEAREPKRAVAIAIAGHRGLCGGYNSGVVRRTQALRRDLLARGLEVELHVSGKKPAAQLAYQGVAVDARILGIDDRPTVAQVEAVLAPLVARFTAGEVDEVHVVYTQFVSAGRQVPTAERILPLERATATSEAGRVVPEYHPHAGAILADLLPRSVRLHLFQAFLDAAVCEQIARMVAMKSATDNAGEMIRDLTMLYNRSRQTLITTELSEIIGGTAALE